MRKLIAAALLAAACCLPASMAQAGPYGDDLAKCVIARTSDQDKMAFMVWMFEAISVHPAVKSLSTVTPAQREASTHQAAGVMQKVLTEDCRKETVAALKYEGMSAIQGAFELFGKVAMQGLMTDPGVAGSMTGLGKDLDGARFDALAKEAGLKPDADPAAKK